MAETRKKSKTHDEDLISELPDEILTRILSFVNSNSALATSVLSKRWKLVWISVPNLEFNFTVNLACFQNLVDRVLSLNKVMSVRNIKFDCYDYDYDVLRATASFESLVTRKAENYHLGMPWPFLDANILLPDVFFNQKNLVELYLAKVVVNVPSTVCFPRLRTINLCYVRLFDDESVKNLLSGCPAITDLLIRSDACSRCNKLYIRSSTLQNLTIHTYCDEIVIDAPNVSYLGLGAGASSYEIINLRYLVKASLFIFKDKNKNRFYELLGKISHVKELILDERTTRELSNSTLIKIAATLHSITHITLSGIYLQRELAFWLLLLIYIPNGLSIIFELENSGHSCWHQSLNLPPSIISCIERVKITIEDDCDYMSVITCYLKSAKGSSTLIFYGFPINVIHLDEFLTKFLPDGDESKINEAFVPGTILELDRLTYDFDSRWH